MSGFYTYLLGFVLGGIVVVIGMLSLLSLCGAGEPFWGL